MEGDARLVLASTSPRRRAILEQLRIPFVVAEPTYEERELPGHEPRELIAAHAEGKARSVAHLHGSQAVLGVDTGVVLGDRLYGKPASPAEAARILNELAGRTHTVVSGLCLLDGAAHASGLAETSVTFRPLSDDQIERYVAAGEWSGLAGGYAIQALGALLVEKIDGDYLNVVGLPTNLLLDTLRLRRPELLALGTY